MTALIKLACSRFVIMASDRRVSNARRQPLDDHWNKILIYEALDGLLAIGGTGMGAIEGVALDEWLAERFIGRSLRDADGRLPTASGSKGVPRWDVGLARKRVTEWLDVAKRRGLLGRDPNQWPVLGVTGWRVNRHIAQPILSTIYATPQGYTWHEAPRRWHLASKDRFGLDIMGSARSHLDLANDLRLRLRSSYTMETAEQAIVEGVRSLAARDSTVGDECLSVAVPRPGYGAITVRYSTPRPETVTIQGSGGVTSLTGYTPWIIGQGIVYAPSEISGGWTVQAGALLVRVVGPSSAGIAFSQGQPENPLLRRMPFR